MQNIQPKSTRPLDEEWYQKLQQATRDIVSTFIMLEPDQAQIAEERKKFFDSGCRRTPDLRPRLLDVVALGSAIEALKGLAVEITTLEPNEYIREAYQGHIDEICTNLRMLSAVAVADYDTYRTCNVDLYGMPDADVFAAVCAWLRRDIAQTSAEEESALASYGADALRLIPALHGDMTMLTPDEKIFHVVRNMHFAEDGFFDRLFGPAGLPDKPYIEQEYGDIITRQAIANIGSDFTVESAVDGLWAVIFKRKQVVRPPGYRVDRDYFVGVIAHEIGSHLTEERNGLLQPLKLLGVGLAGYEKGNEGRAYLREQIIYPDIEVFTRQSSWEYILMLHLAVSLASGVSGKPYGFADLYACLFALHRFFRQRRYPLDTNNEEEAQEEAWLLTVRIMKGTDGTIRAGSCYMKDTVYLEGNIACWRLASHDSNIILEGDKGKFNIADARHMAILQGLNILAKS